MERKLLPDFDSLERASASLVAHIDSHGIPQIQRSLLQLDALSRRLARGHPDQTTESKAQMFLASSGIDVGKYSRAIRDIDLSKTYEPIEPISELEVEKFLEHQHSMLMGTAIEESAKLTANAFRTHYIKRMEEDWENMKRELLEPIKVVPLGQTPGTIRKKDPKASAQSGRSAAQLAFAAFGPAGAKAAEYARVVEEMNNNRQRGSQFNVIGNFLQAAKKAEDLQGRKPQSDVVDCWRLLNHLIGDSQAEKRYSEFVNGGPQEALLLRQDLIRGAKKYSEAIFEEYLKEKTASNLALSGHDEAGKPQLKYQVRGFIKVLLQTSGATRRWPAELEELDRDGYPLWPQIFFCFRCGALDEALDVAKRSGNDNRMRCFISCLEYFVNNPADLEDKGLQDSLWADLVREYNNDVVTKTRDPYKIAMYNLIGRCEPSPQIRPDAIYPTTEDWMWFKLSMLWESSRPLPDWLLKTQRFRDDASRNNKEFLLQGRSLAKLQDDLRSLGPAHFNYDGRTPLLWFTVLLLSQQFEQALAFLVTTDYLTEAIHFAIALDYYGLIRLTPPQIEALLVPLNDLESGPAYAFNQTRAILKYVDALGLASTQPVLAFHYYYTLLPSLFFRKHAIQSSGMDQDEWQDDSLNPVGREALMAVKKLILDTRDFDGLVGTTEGNRVNPSGVIFRFLPDYAKQIVVNAGEDAKSNGNYADAIRLFVLAEEYKTVANVLLERLSRLANAPSSHKERQIMFAQSEQLLSVRPNLDRAQQDSLVLLLRLIQFFDLFHAGVGRYDDAAQVLDSLEIMPASSEPRELEARVSKFHSLEQAFYGFRRNFADVALCCMEIYCTKFAMIKQDMLRGRASAAVVTDTARENILRLYRIKARGLVNFVGMIQLADVNTKLVTMEAKMS